MFIRSTYGKYTGVRARRVLVFDTSGGALARAPVTRCRTPRGHAARAGFCAKPLANRPPVFAAIGILADIFQHR